MNIRIKVISIVTMILLLNIAIVEFEAVARVGGGRSMGSRGSRSYLSPNRSYSDSNSSRQQTARPPVPQAQQPVGGGFLRSFGGGLLGGLVGGMLFRSLGF